MANLYSSDTVGLKLKAAKSNHLTNLCKLCSDCFVAMMHKRLSSPYLPDSEHSDYLVDQLNDIATVCAVAVPPLTTRVLPNYAAAQTPLSPALGQNATVAANGTCPGQKLSPSMQKRSLSLAHSFRKPIRRQNSLSGSEVPIGENSTAIAANCNQLSLRYGVTTGDLQQATDCEDCTIKSSVCLPEKCKTMQVADEATWYA